MGLLVAFGLYSLIQWGIIDGVPNGIVLAVVTIGLAIVIGIFLLTPAIKTMLTTKREVYQIQKNCACGTSEIVELNSFLLFFFPPVKYIDYGVDHLTPWVDPEKTDKKANA